ncbi:3-hydroxyisobutyrate dehydrogenase [Tistlia consotensis]|uniref:3-hydroxyisobutyrate dehydrogenase n=1 Tax=Tistlia consotensis USBA 355 TaxID=560819 RepID=A0A1Y6CBG6_9PROT|nr:3-hydroxyisobutyrate dehydrogenase [Tistlia consotensis]SMF44267.1 3-hydroxyisobutyrate dehydrogenase [Tistlia consotensis USBA 355]SNR43158.1 3-hydroxyisobutyrate dehydrogenase [Tistlia consotensis]
MAAIGFIGLGNMGGPMARNLVKAGHDVKGFDLVPAALEAARAGGIEVVGSAEDAARGVQAVFTMLPAGPHVRAVYLGPGGGGDGQGGLLAAADSGPLFLDCSTIDVDSARAVHAAAEAAGHPMVDAPVSGGVAGAEAGTLTLMVGGSEAAFMKAEPLLKAVGRKAIHAGGPGNGQVAKVCNNMMLGICMLATSEAFTLGKTLGLEPKTLFDIASSASGMNWAMMNHHPLPGIVEAAAANRGYKPGFAAAMMHKDLKLSQAAAASAGVATPLGAEAAQLYTLFVNAGHGDLDYSAIVKLIAGED